MPQFPPPASNPTLRMSPPPPVAQQQQKDGEEDDGKEFSPNLVYNVNARIALWVSISLSFFLAALSLIFSAILVNFAPLRAVMAVYMFSTAAFIITFTTLPLILFCCPATQKMEGDELTPLVSSRSKVWQWRKEYKYTAVLCLLALLVLTSLLLSLRFLAPEYFNPTKHLSFARIASVDSSHAQLFVRLGINSDLKDIRVQVQPVGRARGDEQQGTSFEIRHPPQSFSASLRDELDYTAFVNLTNLRPSSTYAFTIMTDPPLAGEFTTFPRAGNVSSFSFYFGGSFFANFPAFGGENNLGWRYLQNQLDSRARSHQPSCGGNSSESLKPTFVLFLENFVFCDHPWFLGSEFEDYASHYRQTLNSPGVSQVLMNHPSFFMFGEHDVFSNKGGDDTTAYRVWDAYLGQGNPPPPPPLPSAARNLGDSTHSARYYHFQVGDACFFVLDTISHRNYASGTMLGATQKQVLLDWLSNANARKCTFKFIVSSDIWTSALDEGGHSWEAFMEERDEILYFVHNQRLHGCLFLSCSNQMVFAKAELLFAGSNLFEYSSSVLGSFTNDGNFPWRNEVENETEPEFWWAGQEQRFSNMLGLVDVDTTSAMPHMNFSFYDGNERLLHVETLTLGDLVPGSRAPTLTPTHLPTSMTTENHDDDDHDEDDQGEDNQGNGNNNQGNGNNNQGNGNNNQGNGNNNQGNDKTAAWDWHDWDMDDADAFLTEYEV